MINDHFPHEEFARKLMSNDLGLLEEGYGSCILSHLPIFTSLLSLHPSLSAKISFFYL